MTIASLQRVALVVHPARPIAEPVAVLRQWAERHGLDIVEIHSLGSVDRDVAPDGIARPGDLVVAIGGDGTVLSALRVAAQVDAPVLGIACGSLGALAAVTAHELGDALERIYAGDWTPHRLPALSITTATGSHHWAVNDFVAVRRGPGQLVANAYVDDDLYVRLAGDGVVVATALGSSAYSMAAGGPILATETEAFILTPVAMHGGSAPPLVVPSDSQLRVELRPGFAGFDVEIDGHTEGVPELVYTLTLQREKAVLVTFDGASSRLTRLRERRLITDSPRVLARDDRATLG